MKGVIIKIELHKGISHYNHYDCYNIYTYHIIGHVDQWTFSWDINEFFQYSSFYEDAKIIGHMSDAELLAKEL